MTRKDIYVVTGATGNIGEKLVEKLLAAKLKVRVIARPSERLKALASKGAQAFPATLDDAGSITHGFSDAKAVFTMIPPNYETENFRSYQNTISQVLSASITGAGIDYVVNLSSLGAQLSDKVGPVNGLFDHERRLNNLNGANVLHLRPAYFMENHLGAAEMAKKMNIYGSPLKPKLAFPMIATADIAAETAARLIALDFKGKSVKELLGPREYTMEEVTRVIGQMLGRPDLKYVQFPYEEAEKAMEGMGLSKDLAGLFIQMMRSMNDGTFKSTESRTAKNTTSTTFEQFAQVFTQPIVMKTPTKTAKRSAAAGTKRR
jgi:uncharacterized protein YbjT (DUF2867 family)